jgi:AcrR family transcriptional regulator
MTDRRQLRREQTKADILGIAIELMTVDGVAALSLSDVARRLGIQPPSLFKYFPSKLALYDALFALGARGVLAEFQAGVASATPGLTALRAGVASVARFSLANQPLAQLLFWRPVPGFTPSPEAFQPALDFQAEVASVIAVAVSLGELGEGADSEEGVAYFSVLVAGALTQQMANEPLASLESGRFTRLLPQLIDLFANAYPARRS